MFFNNIEILVKNFCVWNKYRNSQIGEQLAMAGCHPDMNYKTHYFPYFGTIYYFTSQIAVIKTRIQL